MLLALELRKYGITVNCYAPGMIFTALSMPFSQPTFVTNTHVNTAQNDELKSRSIDEQTAEMKKVSTLIINIYNERF